MGGFNTQPPEGGWNNLKTDEKPIPSFNTQPPEGGWVGKPVTGFSEIVFQHTAARRRLGPTT